MTIEELLKEARSIWGDEPMALRDILIRLGVDYGDLCRWERNADKDEAFHTDEELKKELGNIIFSTIRWCDDLGFKPEECIELAKEAQEKFAKQTRV